MEPSLPLLGVKTIAMRWGDMDAIGHLNNTYYFRYLEQIRVEWLADMGSVIDPAGVGPVLAATACAFQRALTYPATVEITVELVKLGRSSLQLRHQFRRAGEPDVVYAVGEVTLVWVDYRTGKPVAIPDALRACIAALARGSA